MINPIVIGIAAGLAACVLHASFLYPSALTMLLFFLSPLPIFLVGLGWGVPAAVAGSLAGTIVILSLVGVPPSVSFFATTGASPTALVWLALKSRPSGGNSEEGEADLQGFQWYPEGRLLLWIAVIAASLTAVAFLIIAPDLDAFRAQVAQYIEKVAAAQSPSLSDEEKQGLQALVKPMAAAVPLVATMLWVAIFFVNFRLASAILSALKMGLRPFASFGAMRFPRKAALLLLVILAASFLPGTFGFIGSLFAAAGFAAFAVLGIAVAHGLIERTQVRGALMATLYVSLAFLGGILLVPLAALGLLDMAFPLRTRASKPPANPT
ncbi:MAG: DUF2232 domain-containing protein [Parvibaculaceae bacterium]